VDDFFRSLENGDFLIVRQGNDGIRRVVNENDQLAVQDDRTVVETSHVDHAAFSCLSIVSSGEIL
jgi:hypothetical protein